MNTSPQDGARLRSALAELTAAIDTHLQVVLQRTGESDPAVQAAYTRLRSAAERYDDLLYDLTDEVTPWEFPKGPHLDVEYEDTDAQADHLSVLVRRDYVLVDPAALIVAGREAYGELYPDDPAEAAVADVSHPGRAIYQLLHAHGVDGFDHRAEEAGLAARGGTVWVQAIAPSGSDTLTNEPFSVADEQLLIYRLDEVIHESGSDAR